MTASQAVFERRRFDREVNAPDDDGEILRRGAGPRKRLGAT